MPDRPMHEPDLLHQVTNYLSVIVGFCDVLLAEVPESDPRYADIKEISKAADAAMQLVPQLAKRMI